jgi:pyruvate-formate lyase-activating enzyme
MTPQVVNEAIKLGSDGIAYTYNQPSIFIEFARDCGIKARKNGLFNIFVSKGDDTPETVKMMEFESTLIETLEKLYDIAKEVGFNYAYLRNVPCHPLEHTYCPHAKK